jgi:hypothetical protein
LKSERLLLLAAGLLLGLVASGCRERNPAYIKGKASTDAAAPKDSALQPDRPVDADTPDTGVSQPEGGAREAGIQDAGVDAQDASGDGKPAPVDGVDALEVAGAEVLRDADDKRDLRTGDDSFTLDVLPDTGTTPVDSEKDLPPPADQPDAAGSDTSAVILDGAVDTTVDGPEIVVDAPEGPDGVEGDASDDGLLLLDTEAADTTIDGPGLSEADVL